jgi:large subunit ribosomal protein L2
MSLIVYKKPTTSGQRHAVFVFQKHIKKKHLLKNQSCFLKNNAGRNNQGRITVFRKGAGHKKKYRIISFSRSSLSGIVESIEYDPYRSANIARVFSENVNMHFYILAPEGLLKGHYITSQLDKKELSLKTGNLFYLQHLPLGTFVHNIFFPQKKTGIARAAGCSAQLVSKDANYCRLRLSSGEHRLFPLHTEATLGTVSNPFHKRIVLGKAGRSRWLNRRPTVRGVAMNPIDHPHGGGQGKTAAGRPSVTPWGKLTKGQPTRKSQKHHLIIKKRK